MIFVTVGTQGPFDRLVRTVDEWAGLRAGAEVFAQIGPSDYRPRHMAAARFLDPNEFRRRVAAARIVVAHAGMGSIMTALELGKPIVVMPRRRALREQRNDHQFATARHFGATGRIAVAFEERELLMKLDQLDGATESARIEAPTLPRLIAALRAFLEANAALADPGKAPEHQR